MGCKPILERHRRVVAALMLTLCENRPLRCIHTDRDWAETNWDLPQTVTVEVHVLYCSRCLSVSIQNNYTSNTSGYPCMTSFIACFPIICRRNREGGNINLSSSAVHFWPSVFTTWARFEETLKLYWHRGIANAKASSLFWMWGAGAGLN